MILDALGMKDEGHRPRHAASYAAKSDALELSHDGAGAQVPRHHQLSKSRGSSSDLAIGACSVCVAESPGSAQR